MEAKGKSMIKVVSILMLVGGAFNILAGIMGLAGGGLLAAGGAGDPSLAADAAKLTGIFVVYAIACLVYGIVYILAGVIGLKNCDKVEQAAKCQKWGIISLAVAVVSIIFAFVTGSFTITSVLVLILPIIYILGARKNMQAGA